MRRCPITSETVCRCAYERPELIASAPPDIKGALRVLFTDHALYTSLVLKSIVDTRPDTQVLLTRLLANQREIGNELKPFVGEANGELVAQLLTEHIKLAGAVITEMVQHQESPVVHTVCSLEEKKRALFENSNRVAEALTSLNSLVLLAETTKTMFREHNQFVIDMTQARIDARYEAEVNLYDAYYRELLVLSDLIFEALPKQ